MRPFRVAIAAFLVLFVVGVTAPTYADGWGNGKGPDKSSSATGNETAANQNGAANGNGLARGRTFANGSGSENGSTSSKSHRRSSSGDLNKPQPLSNADRNQGGANGKCLGGPYCSTRDGSESKNGNGNGHAYGKPCAGCVGKADNKNPRGQMPGGSDRNKGYECDGNKGIGRTNPAHTGCKQVIPPKPKPKPKPPAEEKPEVKPPVEKPAAEKPKPAAPRPPAEIPAAQVPAPAAPPAALAPAVLPPTGADTLDTVLGVGGAALLLTGAVLLLRRRTSGTPGRHVS